MSHTTKVIMVRPACFGFNPETSHSNAFQKKDETLQNDDAQAKALVEFDAFVESLTRAGIEVKIYEDTKKPIKPDAIFPNNWISMHEDGIIILYPMTAKNRRPERRKDIVEDLLKKYEVSNVYDLSASESEKKFLEGTGSIVFDHQHKFAFATLSPRTDEKLLVNMCSLIGYKPVVFHANDGNGQAIYHTNVMMCMAVGVVVICLAAISDEFERGVITKLLRHTNHEIVDISFEQMNQFAGNLLMLKNKNDENILVLSQTAFNALDGAQRNTLSKFAKLLTVNIPTIEKLGGGSARCMIAENYLQEKVM